MSSIARTQLESFLRTTTSSTLEKYCHCVVNRLIQLTPDAHRDTVFHHSRFNDEFRSEEESDEKDDDGSLQNLHTRKSIRLYNDFITSDMIIASPLGLQLALGKEEDKKRLSKEKDNK
ncbi:BnaCnng23040D [Brassica napus]|uniref:BnaCnng23040D protein n=1 Tax=Brassica napus TaxID=3708 RepID=A0A078IS03_BRANA|nr:BnaCnng23040D [Brassica napus]